MSEHNRSKRRIVLASASPRRAWLLREAGFEVECLAADLDDADLAPHGSTPTRWVLAMAWLKAARVRSCLLAEGGVLHHDATLVAADTVCDCDGQIIGKPTDRAEAEATLRRLVGRAHQVHTGVCAVDLPLGRRHLFVDSSTVTLGALDETVLQRYLDGDGWRGKAGGYNYADRLADGWPLACVGDPTSVMGLPMRRLAQLFGLADDAAESIA